MNEFGSDDVRIPTPLICPGMLIYYYGRLLLVISNQHESSKDNLDLFHYRKLVVFIDGKIKILNKYCHDSFRILSS